MMAVLCLVVGCAVGYLLRGSVGHSASARSTAGQQQQVQGMPLAGGQQQMPSPEQLKAMADKQAAPLLEQLKSKPSDPALLSQIGNLYYDAGDFPLAIDYYQKALANDPKNALVRTDMGTAMAQIRDTDQAITEFDRALKDNPKYYTALYNRGLVKWQGKMDVKGALADWELLLKEDPKFEHADRARMLVAQVKKHANIKPDQKSDKPAM
jgi:tetratricopeptide (TPR) repeat protein